MWNQNGLSPIIITILISILIGGYLIYSQKNTPTGQTVNTNLSTLPSPAQVKIEPSSTPIINKGGMILYEHPKAHYTLEYPSSWKGGTESIPSGLKLDYEDFFISSPDHPLKDEYSLLKGAEIFIRVENSDEKSIEDIFNNDPLAPEIAINKTKTVVDGVDAIQYDYSYESNIATMTIFIKDGKYYTVKYRYVDSNSKQSDWNTYMNLLKSFKTQ